VRASPPEIPGIGKVAICNGNGAASPLHPDAPWSTPSPFAEIHGAENVAAFINTKLSPSEFGPAYAQHRMEVAADIDNLTVTTPAGERCSFRMEVETLNEDGQNRMVIRKLFG